MHVLMQLCCNYYSTLPPCKPRDFLSYEPHKVRDITVSQLIEACRKLTIKRPSQSLTGMSLFHQPANTEVGAHLVITMYGFFCAM